MSARSELRAWAIELYPACWWPHCDVPRETFEGVLELAHVKGRGMGHKGDRDRKDNVVILCRLHHRHYDGLEPVTQQSREALLRQVIAMGAAVDQRDSDRYMLTGVAEKWRLRRWVDMVRVWRWHQAGVDDHQDEETP